MKTDNIEAFLSLGSAVPGRSGVWVGKDSRLFFTNGYSIMSLPNEPKFRRPLARPTYSAELQEEMFTLYEQRYDFAHCTFCIVPKITELAKRKEPFWPECGNMPSDYGEHVTGYWFDPKIILPVARLFRHYEANIMEPTGRNDFPILLLRSLDFSGAAIIFPMRRKEST